MDAMLCGDAKWAVASGFETEQDLECTEEHGCMADAAPCHVSDKAKQHQLYVHRKGATRAFASEHKSLPGELNKVGQSVIIGGSMGTGSYILAGSTGSEQRAFSFACPGDEPASS